MQSTIRSPRFWTIIGSAAALLVVAFSTSYFLLFRGSNVAPLAISPSPTPTSAASATPPPEPAATFAANWTVAPSSTAGYRVREKLAILPATSDAVGRTSAVTGTAALRAAGPDLILQSASISADLTQLKSDSTRRDDRIRGLGIESDRFPSATFQLASPVTVAVRPQEGAQVQITINGSLTLHGVTKSVDLPVTAQLSRDQIMVVGSLTFPWGDFGMRAPNIAGVVSIQSDPIMEFSLVLKREGAA
jgi:polyisoprenoid-binding protein YceI